MTLERKTNSISAAVPFQLPDRSRSPIAVTACRGSRPSRVRVCMASTQKNKRHKRRFASKSRATAHRTEVNAAGRTIGKPRATATRAARAAHTKMVRDHKRAALLSHKRDSSGPSFPPRVIVLFGLSAHADVDSLAKDLLEAIAGEGREVTSNTIASATHKLRTTVLKAPHDDLLTCMELAKVADLIGFVVSANLLSDKDTTCSVVDSFGTECLSVFRAMGLPSTAVFLRDLPMDIKSKQHFKKMTLASLASELPDDCKFCHADTKEDLHRFIRIFKEQNVSVPHWRTQRPYVMAHEVGVKLGVDSQGLCILHVSGYVRAHNLSINQLVHVSGVGDFQLEKIEIVKDPFPYSERKEYNFMDSDNNNYGEVVDTLVPDPLNQEPLLVENSSDPLAGEQTWPTEAEMVEADKNNKVQKLKKKRLPHGTSDYQAAWILNDTDSDDSYDEDHMVLNEQREDLLDEGFARSDKIESSNSMVDADEGTEADVDMTDDNCLTKEQIEAEIKKIKCETAEDIEFPDEVDTPIDVPAKRRFAKYRGLKSFRTSSWDPMESLPPEFSRIFAFDRFSRTHKHVLEKVGNCDGLMGDCAPVGSFVKLYIKHVPGDIASKLCVSSKTVPLIACGLLQHESKMSVLHFSIRKHDSCNAPIKSKDTLTFHVGFRQFIARPLFSSDNLNCDKHKMERFLHPGCFSVASVYAPICFPSLPLIALKQEERPTVAAIGSLKSVNPNRVVLKKIILTGYPQRVSKLKAIVRFMFHRPDDVKWFKPVNLWTKRGRVGHIKEPIGTHGAMKCVFNEALQQHDTVCMNLYKRVYPKWPEQVYLR